MAEPDMGFVATDESESHTEAEQALESIATAELGLVNPDEYPTRVTEIDPDFGKFIGF
jgi:hypothetical protein